MRNIYLLLVSILFCSSILAQEITVKGRVISQEEPDGIPGVAIMVKGTTTGTVTDVDGNYSIKANAKAVLQFSSIGYTPYEVVVGDRGIINVELQTSVEQLEEVVVVGYGEQKKASIVGSVSNMKNDDLIKDIDRCKILLNKGIYNTKTFCYPFGGVEDVSEEAMNIVQLKGI